MSSTGRRRLAASLFESFADPGHEPAHLQQVGHELWKGFRPVFVTLREIADDSLLEIDFELVALLHGLRGLRRLHDRVAHVDRVAEEDPRKRVRDHKRDARSPDGDRRDLARRAASEVGATDQDVALCDPRRPRVAAGHPFHRVLAKLLLVEGVDRVLGRDDLVGVDVVGELPGSAAHDLRKSHGLAGKSAAAAWGRGRTSVTITAMTSAPTAKVIITGTMYLESIDCCAA